MNYSNDDDHTESDPWAASPKASKTSFSSQETPQPHFASAESSQHPTQTQSSNTDEPYSQQQQLQREQQQQQPSARPQNLPANDDTQRRADKPLHKLQAKITSLERNGRKDPILKFDVYTNLPNFRTTQYRDVRRTHAEFIKYAEHLMSANPEAMVPAVPPASTAAGAGTEEDENKVKTNMQRWLNIVTANELLTKDEETQYFVESDFGYSPVQRKKQPATGMRRKVIKQFAPPPDNCVELAETRPVVKLFYLGTMDAGQKLDRVVKNRRALGLSESQLGVTLSQLSPQENHPGLSAAYRKLGVIIRAVGDFHLAQGTFEASSLSDPLQYISSDAFVVKETLTNRQILMRDLLSAQTSTKSKLSSADRLRTSSSVKRDKVDEAIAALEEAKKYEENLDKKCAAVTKNLILERRLWFERTSATLQVSLREYVIRQIEAERRTLATLESVRPDIRAIDASGGLSRLGREAHPKIRKSSLASSQTTKGDAWSGVQRRPDGVRRAESGAVSGLVAPEEPETDETFAQQQKTKSGGLKGLVEEDDEDRVDARNAASRLAQTTF